MSNRILVVGSTNMDLIVQTDRLPAPGETVVGGTFAQAHGGKGANQAVAAARSGGKVTFLSAVGDDAFGLDCLAAIKSEGIDTAHARVVRAATGIALITVDTNAENCIVVAPGANATVGAVQIEEAFTALTDLAVCICQLETPLPAVHHALSIAKKKNLVTILDPAPAIPLEASLLHNVDCITPNTTEAEKLTGIRPDTMHSAVASAHKLRESGVGTVIITLGSKGAILVDESEPLTMSAPKVEAVDSTAAGDSFTGCLGARVSNGETFRQALPYAVCAGALAATTCGAQPSIPIAGRIDCLKNEFFGLDD
ncbi:MAG: ribokinase [Candidatus Latescibacterota bacterium]|nr:ribokinase [Candidatus Latescibacterota bacterium]